MSCGCPVVAYGSGGVPETVVNGLNGRWVLTGDYSQLLQTTLDLIDNESENNRMRKYSREYVVKNFSLRQMLDSYERTLFEFAKA
jgi:glycosyltransferase involved in cell wall biosynthesis